MISERIRIDETSHPIDIKIRRLLKGVFLKELYKATSTDAQDFNGTTSIVIYGSTIMRQLVDEEKAVFPLSGIKSSDIDIGCFTSGNSYSTTISDAEFQAIVTPRIRAAIISSQFELWLPEPNYTEKQPHKVEHKLSNGEIRALDSLPLRKDFYVAKSFTKDEIIALLKDDPEYEQIEPYIRNHFDAKKREVKTVCLCISPHTEHFPLIMQPISLFRDSNGEGVSQLVRANRFDMLAGKIARSMGSNMKATDIVDIYNMIHGTTGAGKPTIDTSKDSVDLDLIRLLTMNYLLCAYGQFDCKKPGLLRNFEPSEANAENFKTSTSHQIVEYKQPELHSQLNKIFSSVNDFIALVFRKKSQGLSFGPLNLTLGEYNYIGEFGGEAKIRPKQIPGKRSWRDILSGRTPPTTLGFEADSSASSYIIDTKALEQEFPKVFEKYPNFGDLLKKNTLLQSKLRFNQYGPEQAPYDTLGDF